MRASREFAEISAWTDTSAERPKLPSSRVVRERIPIFVKLLSAAFVCAVGFIVFQIFIIVMPV